MVDRTNSRLLLNSSYSGTTICHTGYNGKDCSKISFVARMNALIEQAYFQENQVDTLIIYGGLNDYWANAPLGELLYENWSENDLYSVYPAFTYLLTTAKENLPNGRILFVLEEYLGEEMKAGLETACRDLEVECIVTKDIKKTSSHPNLFGMKQLADQIITYLEDKENGPI